MSSNSDQFHQQEAKQPRAQPQVLLSRQTSFCVGLKLRNADWTEETNQRVFGRDYKPHGAELQLRVALRGRVSPLDGMIVNLTEVKPVMKRVVELLEDKFLDEDVDYFRVCRPTTENMAAFCWKNWPNFIGQGQLYRMDLERSNGTKVEILVDSVNMKVSHSYEFAAAHRLFVPSLTQQENWERFDKCSNQAGHGHNFQLRVWVEGTPDEETGYIINPRLLDAIVEEEVYSRFDHKHLNEDCPEFVGSGKVPTSENLAATIFDLLKIRLDNEGFRLARIGLQETQKNYFEVEA